MPVPSSARRASLKMFGWNHPFQSSVEEAKKSWKRRRAESRSMSSLLNRIVSIYGCASSFGITLHCLRSRPTIREIFGTQLREIEPSIPATGRGISILRMYIASGFRTRDRLVCSQKSASIHAGGNIGDRIRGGIRYANSWKRRCRKSPFPT